MLHPLVQENYYLRRRVAELERENQHIRLMLAAKTLIINKVEFNLDNIDIDTLSGSLQIGITHQAQTEGSREGTVSLPHLPERPIMEI
ncbi:spore germination protein GerPC [Tumebacillus permanentifrigoris]|uniref:Spore germination protein GerPC n=1 Tax=Tumebacillus permanentifrigoris TaxID=378543 RepID=A0A316DCI6_9BACL|nr:spore germination protein GerPC [Tumebacillus permanentifrigoris]PWK15921.1 spore germination protein GerPC [Tumebacillus permanentifrigoris]